jgi:hypothetical protein
MDQESLILGELREFKRASLVRFDQLEKKVNSIDQFRAKLIGASMIVAGIVGGIMDLLRHQ